MTPTQLISVINGSARITTENARLMTTAVGRQLAEHFAPIYGLVPALEFIEPGGTPTAGGCPCYLLDEPDQDGVLGYHGEDSNGVPYIKVFANPSLAYGGSVLSGAGSIATTLSHEALELAADGPANKWVDGPDGRDYAYEVCDAVEGDAYPILVDGTFVSVSNFVFPAYFDPRAEAGSRFDQMGKLGRPFTMTPGGYLIVRTEPGAVSHVFGAVPAPPGGVQVVFGEDFPERLRAGKVAKVLRKRGKRSTSAA